MSRRARRRKRAKPLQDNDTDKKGYDFGCGVNCDLIFNSKRSEEWPTDHVLMEKSEANALSLLIDEIKNIDVGVKFDFQWSALTELRAILAKLVHRHSTAPYKYIAWHYASKVGSKRKTRSQTSASKPEIEEAWSHYNSHESPSSACKKDRLKLLLEHANQFGGGGSNSNRLERNNMHESVHPNIILLFLRSSIRHTVPDEIFGTQANKKVFIKRWLPVLYQFRGRKSMALGRLMNGVAISKVHWSREVGSIGGRGKRAHVVAKVWLWLLTQYLACLVSCHFVLVNVSGGNDAGVQEAFFAKRIWQSWTESAIAAHTFPDGTHLKAPQKGWRLTPVSADEKLVIKQSGDSLISTLQFRVKRHGVRPIMKVRYPPEKYELKKACQALLRYLLHDDANKDPITKLSIAWKKLHDMWRERSLKANEADKEQPFLYAVKVDVEDAYGSVILEKMCDILWEELVKADLRSDSMVSIKAMKRFKKLISGKYVYKERHILEGINIKPDNGQNESSLGWKFKWKKSFQIRQLMLFLEKSIIGQIVRNGRQLYHLTQGLVQGSIFSPMLWDIYLRNLVVKHLLPHLSDGSTELICGADDILFLTNSQEKAEWFLQKMLGGFPDYNVTINSRKIYTNLSGYKDNDFITFWGFALDPKTGHAIGHFAGNPDRDLCDTMKLSVLKDPWRLLKSTLLFGNTKLCLLTMNPDHNRKRILLCNVFRAALWLAARYHAIAKVVLKSLGLKVRLLKDGNTSKPSLQNNIPDCPPNVVDPCTAPKNEAKGEKKYLNNQILLTNYIKNRVRFLFRCIEKLKEKHGIETRLTAEEIEWLSYKAFKVILGRNGGYYPEVMKRIKLLQKGVAKRLADEKITELQDIAEICQK
ncbi:uncharacterized protein LOC124157262 [Ischnura elegans]|uniref:uncharacterized protein LOC124157262 n=1 Tax=Ischnura elegans TaxID=197161 RepID=UPI001ED86CAE|nr:uncharacterized protein LOC124157262 [Ischnura elegans]